jgi:hypothetical protein
LESFTAIWYNLWPFGIVCGQLVYFPLFLVFSDQENSGDAAKHKQVDWTGTTGYREPTKSHSGSEAKYISNFVEMEISNFVETETTSW